MKIPPGVSPKDFDEAIRQFEEAVGKEWVFTSDEDVALYRDAYSANPILAIPGGLGSGLGTPADAQAEILGVLGLYSRFVPASAAATSPDEGGFFSYAPRATQGNTQPENYFLGRIDYTISSNDSLFGRYISDRSTQTVPYPASEFSTAWPEIDKSATMRATTSTAINDKYRQSQCVLLSV